MRTCGDCRHYQPCQGRPDGTCAARSLAYVKDRVSYRHVWHVTSRWPACPIYQPVSTDATQAPPAL